MRTVLALVLVLLLLGCTRAPAGSPATTASFHTAWNVGAAAFTMNVSGDLPANAAVVVQDATANDAQSFQVSNLTRVNGSYEIPATLKLVGSHRYHVALRSGEKTLAERDVTAVNETTPLPQNISAHATYEYRATTHNRSGDDVSDMSFTMRVAADAQDGHLAFKGNGTGDANLTNSSSEFRFHLDRVVLETLDGNATAQDMHGVGTWRVNTDQGTGSGDATIRVSLVGHEAPPAASGVARVLDVVVTRMNLTGTFDAGGFGVPMQLRGVETAWNDPDTGDTLWKRTNTTTTVTIFGQPQTSYDEHEGAEPSQTNAGNAWDLLTGKVAAGARPYPAMAGDAFEEQDAHGHVTRATIQDAPAQTVSGRSLAALRIVGRGEGTTLNQTIAADPALALMPLQGTGTAIVGNETSEMTMTILTLT